MNRDESRTRPEAGLAIIKQHPVAVAYPRDARSGGTWCGINNKGVVLCLLNRYQDKGHKGGQSRGMIIPNALTRNSDEAIHFYLESLQKPAFSPFDLLLITLRQLRRYRWNGRDWKVTTECCKPPALPFMKSSSSRDTAAVLRHRAHLFQQWQSNNQDTSVLSAFHLCQDPADTSSSVLMSRTPTHTKSITQIHLTQRQVQLRYCPEASLPLLIEQKSFAAGNYPCAFLSI